MSLIALSNRILSGCLVCYVIGFSYFLCLNAQELTARAIAPVSTRATASLNHGNTKISYKKLMSNLLTIPELAVASCAIRRISSKAAGGFTV